MQTQQIIPKITHQDFKRPLNTNEVGLGLLISASLHYMIRKIDDLSHTSLFSQKVKLTGKAFLKEIEKHQNDNLWTESPEGSDINRAADQMESISDMFHNLLVLCLAMDSIPMSDQQLFWVEMQKNFKRFGLPLRMTPEGELQFLPLNLTINQQSQ